MKKALIVIAIIVLIGGILIFSNGSYDLSSREGLVGFVKAYGLWAKTIVGNVVDVTGYAVKKPWLPQ